MLWHNSGRQNTVGVQMQQPVPRSFLLSIALICHLLLAAGPLAAQKTEVNRLMQIGSQKYQAGDMEGAIADFRQGAVLQPGDPTVFFALPGALGGRGPL